MTQIVFLLFIVGWVVFALIGCIAFDKVIRLQHNHFRKSWEKDGRPFGIFWVPLEVRRSGFWAFIQSSSASGRAKFDWLFVTPAWIKDSSEARAWLYAYRLIVLGSLVMPIAAVVFLEYLA
jgi:hypothetical protein